MTNVELYRGLSAVDHDLVEQAAPPARPTLFALPGRGLRRAAAAVACAALLCVGGYQLLFRTAATLYLTINPQVSIALNQLGGVTGVTARNSDGAALLSGYRYQGKDRLTVTQELVDRARELGYLADDGQVTISITADSTETAKKYDDELSAQLAAGDAVALAVRELLPVSQVKQIALAHFGLSSGTLTRIECDAEHARVVYEVELRSGGIEYECTIDAITGAVLDSEQEAADDTVNAAAATLTLEQAKAAALAHAGLTQAEFYQAALDEEDGRPVYELAFKTADARYECEVDAATGAVLDFDAEYTAASLPGSGADGPDDPDDLDDLDDLVDDLDDLDDLDGGQPASAGSPVTLEQAKGIALARAGLGDATFPLAHQLTINGVTVYQLKFYTATGDYYCVVQASTGSILEYDANSREGGHEHESAYSYGSGSALAAAISEADAKAAALARAGLSEASWEKTELDLDDGVLVYELEFHAGGWEYECTVDAATGAVLSWEADDHH